MVLQLTEFTGPHTSRNKILPSVLDAIAMTHVVILPYFSEQEIARYKRILERLANYPTAKCAFHFLLAASPKAEPNQELAKICRQIAPTVSFQCPTKIFGYPAGPTAMFWDCMEFIDRQFDNDHGFSLWLESDMTPVKPDWMDRLDQQWRATTTDNENPPLMMGCYVPKVYKQRLLRRKKLLLDDHINGGACYAKHFAKLMPEKAKQGVFDVVVYRYAKHLGRVKQTDLIDFSSVTRARRDVLDPNKVILHGFMQDKDLFIDQCLKPVTEREMQQACWHPMIDRMETLRRQARVWFVRRGHQAMYENMLLAKQSQSKKAA